MVQRNSQNSREVWRPIVAGLIAGSMSALFLMMISAWVMVAKDFNDTAVMILSYLILIVSCFIGGFVSSGIAGKQGIKAGAIIGGLIFLLVLCIAVVVNGFNGNIHLLLKSILSILTGMIGGIIGVNSIGKRKLK